MYEGRALDRGSGRGNGMRRVGVNSIASGPQSGSQSGSGLTIREMISAIYCGHLATAGLTLHRGKARARVRVRVRDELSLRLH